MAPRGQLWDGPSPGVQGFCVHAVRDPSLRGQKWMDVYDAVLARARLCQG